MSTIDDLREFRDRLIISGAIVARADGQLRDLFSVAVGPKEGAALRDWVTRENAHRTLETGLGFAIATLFICEGLLENGEDGNHVAADPFQSDVISKLGHGTTYAGAGLQILEEAGVRELVEFYAEESQIVLPRLLSEGRRFDLAFLDGSHRFESVFLDLIYSGRLLKEGGIIFVDDVQIPSVRRAVDFCLANLRWDIQEVGSEGDHEWLVLRTGPAEVFSRPYTEFVDF